METIIADRPGFYHPLMSALAEILAIHTDPKVRDPQAALAIAKHGARATQYADTDNLKALAAAYAAAGLPDEATKTLNTLQELASPDPTPQGP